MAVEESHFSGSKLHSGDEVIGIAPELDGLQCFETLARVGTDAKPAFPKSQQTMSARYAPEFNGLDSFETLVKMSVKSFSKKVAASVPEIRMEKSGEEFDARRQDKMKNTPEVLTRRFALEFDGLHCFETLLRQ